MSPADYGELAYHYAPIFVQEITNAWRLGDQIAPLDLNGHITAAAENPCALLKMPGNRVITDPKIYYSVCETTTHFFVLYMVYHPLNWRDKAPDDFLGGAVENLEQHAHDVQGVLLVITKAPDALVDGVFTISQQRIELFTQPHDVAGDYRYPGWSLQLADLDAEVIAGRIWLYSDMAGVERAQMHVAARSHIIRGESLYEQEDGDESWWYYPTAQPKAPSRTVKGDVRLFYQLEDIFVAGGLWTQRFDPRIFAQQPNGQWAFVVGGCGGPQGKYERGLGVPPWSWQGPQATSPFGEIATDPAGFITQMAQGWGPVSNQYLYNPYMNIGV